MAKKNELSKLDGMLGDYENDFLDNVESDDIVFPRLKLMQAMSDAVSSGEARPGDVVLNLDGHLYLEANKTLEFIPLFYWHSRIMFAPLETGGGILCRANDGKIGEGTPGGDCISCGMKDWQKGTDGKNVSPPCIRVHNFAILCPQESGEHRVAILPLSKTSFKVGTQMLNRMRSLKGPAFAYSFQLTTELREGSMAKYWTYGLRKFDDVNRIDRRIDAHKDWESLFSESKQASEMFKDMFKEGKLAESQESENGQESNDTENEVPF